MQCFADFEKKKPVLLKLDLKHIQLNVCAYMKPVGIYVSLFFNIHVVRVKLDPKEVTELQELFAWRGCWKHCNMSNWNSNKPNKLAHIYWQFREMKVLISTGHRPTSSQTEAVLMGWGWWKTLPKAYLVLPRREMPLKCWHLKQSLFQLRISLFCCPLTSLALPL